MDYLTNLTTSIIVDNTIPTAKQFPISFRSGLDSYLKNVFNTTHFVFLFCAARIFSPPFFSCFPVVLPPLFA